MVRFNQILNPLILADKWVGFNGDSEFINEDGELMMGSWTFVGILDESAIDSVEKKYGIFDLDDEINEDALIDQELMFPVWDAKKNFVCAVQFHYRGDDDE